MEGRLLPDPQDYHTPINNSQGIVVGEHNKIYQYFQLPDHAHLPRDHIKFFATLIADKTEKFVGRQFVFDALDHFLQQHNSGYFIIQGEPGIGKTAVLAEIVKRRGYPHHFNIASMNIRTPHQFLANACAQIIVRYNLPYKFLPPYATDDSAFLVQCLAEAAGSAENRPVVLVIDALDEAERQNLTGGVNPLYLPPILPQGAYIVITTRHTDDFQLQAEIQETIFLESGSAGNLLDIQEYIDNELKINEKLKNRLIQLNESEEGFIAKLRKKSEGNFIYLRYVLPLIGEGKFNKGTVDELPQGLKAYYRVHWNSMRAANLSEFDDLYMPIVCILAVTRVPVTEIQLQKWTLIDIKRIRLALRQWREFLKEESMDNEKRFRIYHLSFQDFLREQIDLNLFHEMIARYYLEQIDSDG